MVRGICLIYYMFICSDSVTACEITRQETVKRARALGNVDDNSIALPTCDPVGDFEPVQCDPLTGNCFCVDQAGFELAGTRARSLDLVNCTSEFPFLFLVLFMPAVDLQLQPLTFV